MKFAAVVCLAARAICAQPASAPAFDVASVKISTEPEGHSGAHTDPGYLRIQNQTLKQCIMEAYGVRGFQIAGGPKWMEAQRFQIDARSGAPAPDDQLMLMLRALLADRFHLALHRETRPAKGYALVVGKDGMKIQPNEAGGPSSTHHSNHSFTAVNMSTAKLAATVSDALGAPVTDATGLKGVFDIALEWAPEEARTNARDNSQATLLQNPSALPTLPEVLQQKLGLRLESRKVAMEILIIDGAEMPAEN